MVAFLAGARLAITDASDAGLSIHSVTSTVEPTATTPGTTMRGSSVKASANACWASASSW